MYWGWSQQTFPLIFALGGYRIYIYVTCNMYIYIITCKCVCVHMCKKILFWDTTLVDLKSTCSDLSTSPPGTAFQGFSVPIHPRKINMESQNDTFQKEFPFPRAHFQVPCETSGCIYKLSSLNLGLGSNWSNKDRRPSTWRHGPENVGTDTHLIKGIKET